MSVLDFYNGKNILITGTTGFLGKIVLEKLLRVVPNIGKIYVLIRKKQGSSTVERFKKEVIGSPCFDRVRKERKDLEQFCQNNLIPIAGDLLSEGLGLSAEDFELITSNVHVIVNSAASVDFNARLDEAIQTNVKGTIRMFDLAKHIKNLENFVHISTCYVNSEKNWIEEKVYELDFDVDEKVKELEALSVDDIVNNTEKLISPFPNTYCYAKALAEQILKKYKGTTPVTIVRPAIIGSSWREPFPGWVDTISAAGAVYFLGAIGLINVVQGLLKNVGDQIPVDFVSDAIIVSAAKYAGSTALNVVHSASSTQNPITWKRATDIVINYYLDNLPSKRVAKPHFRFVSTQRELKLRQKARRFTPAVYMQTAKILKSPTMMKKAAFFQKILKRSEEVAETFRYFTMNEWFYATDNIKELQIFCSPEELRLFNLNVSMINWEQYLPYFAWGLKRFILKEESDPPDGPKNMNVIKKEQKNYLKDIQSAFTKGRSFTSRSNSEMKSLILSSAKVQEVIKELASKTPSKHFTEDQMVKNLYKKAEEICNTMFATYSMPVIRLMSWSMNKVLKSVYDKVVVDETMLLKLRQFNQKEDGPVILMPTHRSYMDFLIVSYVFFTYGLKCPHVAAVEDFLSLSLVHKLLRSSGAFFLPKKGSEHRELHKTILSEYIQNLLVDESWLEIYIEGARSKVGKMLSPKFGLLSIVTDAFFDRKVNDCQIVPITINYDRVVEGESFPLELLGEAKMQESLLRLVRAAKVLTKNFGRVYIELTEPISLKQYTEKYIQGKEGQISPYVDSRLRMDLVTQLGNDVINKLQKAVVIMPTTIVASVLLLHRKGINEEELIKKVEWVSNELINRQVKVGTIYQTSSTVAVKMALSHLSTLLNQKKDIFHPLVSAKADYKNILMLSYYRNSLLHVFFSESLIVCSLMAFGHDVSYKEGISLDRLYEEVVFLQGLLSRELAVKQQMTKVDFKELIDSMTTQGLLTLFNNTSIRVVSDADQYPIQYLCSLIWPFVESYWCATVFCFSLKSRKLNPKVSIFLQEVQYFAETMYEERSLECFEACSLDTLKNAYSCLKDLGILKEETVQGESKKVVNKVVLLKVSEERLMEVEGHVKKFMKHSYTTSVRSPVDRARTTSFFDSPTIMGKL